MGGDKYLIPVNKSDTYFVDQKLCLYYYIINKIILFEEINNKTNVIYNNVGIFVVC